MTIGSILCASARMNRCDHLVQRPRRSGIGADFIHSSSRFILRPFCSITVDVSNAAFCGGGQGDDENASRKSSDSHESLKDDKSNEVKDADDHPIAILTSALTNASNKPAEPTSKEAHHRMMDSREFH